MGVGRESDKTEKLQRILFIRVLWVFNLASVWWRFSDHHNGAVVDARRRCVHQHSDGTPAVLDRVGFG